jgi:hypothetical protein
MAIKIVKTQEFRYGSDVRHETVYVDMADELIAAGIIPADFFKFRGRSRRCSREWWGRRKPTNTTFPPHVSRINMERCAGDRCVAEI